MHMEDGHIVETPVQARAGFISAILVNRFQLHSIRLIHLFLQQQKFTHRRKMTLHKLTRKGRDQFPDRATILCCSGAYAHGLRSTLS
jgi:hypothetical protein